MAATKCVVVGVPVSGIPETVPSPVGAVTSMPGGWLGRNDDGKGCEVPARARVRSLGRDDGGFSVALGEGRIAPEDPGPRRGDSYLEFAATVSSPRTIRWADFWGAGAVSRSRFSPRLFGRCGAGERHAGIARPGIRHPPMVEPCKTDRRAEKRRRPRRPPWSRVGRVNQWCRRRATATKPTSPEPNSQAAAGSGTSVAWPLYISMCDQYSEALLVKSNR